MNQERVLTQTQWAETNFPSCPLPDSVSGVVNITAWDNRIAELLDAHQVNEGLVRLMKEARQQLAQGADSHVGREREEILAGLTGFRIRFQEAGGTQLANMFSTDLAKGKHCERKGVPYMHKLR